MPPFLVRVLSAVVMAPIALTAVYFGGLWFQSLIIIATIVGVIELFRMSSYAPSMPIRMAWFVPGVIYLIIAGGCLIWLRGVNDTGFIVVCWLFALVWGTDSGAYVAGTMIGGPKLAPRISPNKTWAGLIGGMITAAIIGYSAHVLFDLSNSAASIIILSIALAFLSQCGDLLESGAKRYFGVKDSGTIIPGHGGVLDRIDGLVAAAIGAGVARWAFQEHSGLWL